MNKQMLRFKLVAGMAIILFCIWVSPALSPFDPNQISDESGLFVALDGVSAKHWLGTNALGMDLFTRLLFGAQTALLVVLPVIAISFLLGVFAGTLAGWFRGWVDQLLRAFFDFGFAMPGILFAIALSFGISGGRPSYFSAITSVVIAESLSYSARFFYATRARVLVIANELYVQASLSMGARSSQIFSKHFIVDVSALTLPLLPQTAAASIASLAGLGFLGIGVSYGTGAEWGFDLAQAIGPAMMGNFLPLLASAAPIFVSLLCLGLLSEKLLQKNNFNIEVLKH